MRDVDLCQMIKRQKKKINGNFRWNEGNFLVYWMRYAVRTEKRK